MTEIAYSYSALEESKSAGESIEKLAVGLLGMKDYSYPFRSLLVLTDALAGQSEEALGIGISHGWEPAGDPMRVTKSEGMRLIGLNAGPAFEAFKAHAEKTGQELDPANPLSFFPMSEVLGRVPYVGCNTYGRIAKVDGQFNGFHNCTAVVCAFPG